MQRKLSAAAVVAVLAVVSCQSDQPVASRLTPPSADISDGNHTAPGFARNPHFFLLPPIVEAPSPTGAFNPGLSPVVQVCNQTVTPCPVGQEHARFTARLEVDHYVVNWNTDPTTEPAGAAYRIAVLVHKTILGFADVKVITTGKVKNAVTGDSVPLVDGRTLPIKFRIETHAVCLETGLTTSGLPCAEQPASPTTDNTILASDGLAGTFIPAGALTQPVTVSIVKNTDRPCIPPPFAGRQFEGCYDFFTDPGPTHFNTLVTVGICVERGLDFSVGQRLEIFQFDEGQPARLLPEVSAGFLGCDADDPYRESQIGRVGPGRVGALALAGLRRAWSYLAPAVLHAAHDGVGGTTDSYSTFGWALPPVAWGQVGAGNQHTCAATADSIPYCWGRNGVGQLGNGTTTPSLIPTAVAGGHFFGSISSAGAAFSSGDQGHSCGATGGPTGGAGAYCWGASANNELGNGSTANQSSPVAVSGGATFIQVSINIFHTCATASGGTAYCWGLGASGRLGTESVANQPTPAVVAGRHVFRFVSAGGDHTCGVTTANEAYCWGNNRQGQLGRGAAPGGGPASEEDSTPILVAGGHQWFSVSAGNTHTCGVTTSNVAYCWGNDEFGRLGLGATASETCPGLSEGTTPCSTSPAAVAGGHAFSSVSAGTFHSCGLTTSGAAYCWGANDVGELGDGAVGGTSATPVAVSGGNTYQSISAGSFHTCAVRTDQALLCWGSNGGGELGDGSTVNRSTPVRVAEP